MLVGAYLVYFHPSEFDAKLEGGSRQESIRKIEKMVGRKSRRVFLVALVSFILGK